MKHIYFYAVIAILIASCSEDAKNIITPDIPLQNTLPIENPTISLNYLQRDTLILSHNIDPDRVNLRIFEGDSCISIVGKNVIVGRRKGTAKVLAEYDNMSSIVTVNVVSEEYVPIKALICNINGAIYKSDSPTTWQCCQMLKIKLNGVEPANTTFHEVADISINSYDENGSLWWKAEDILANVHGYSKAKKAGKIEELDTISLRVFPRNGFKVDNTPCFIVSVDLKIWPSDITLTEWDKSQIEKSYGEAENNIVRKSFIFNANENQVSVNKDASAIGIKEHIYIKSGETKQLSASLLYPDEFNSQVFITWSMDESHNEYINQGNLSLTKNGILSLSSSYSGENYPYYNGLQNDTVYIGYLRANFLMAGSEQYSQLFEKYKCTENEGNMCYQNARHWVSKLQKEDKVDIYWVRK